MSHFYTINEDGTAQLNTSINSVAEARKAKGLNVVSITTKLSAIIKDEHFEHRQLEQCIQLHDLNPRLNTQELKNLSYGTVLAPTGEEIPSSQFGTKVHNELENAINGDPVDPLWTKWVQPTLDFIEKERIHPTHAELQLGSKELLLAGTIDGVGMMNGKAVIWDYKCRKSNWVGEKDGLQLELCALLLKEHFQLDYIPEIYTIVILTGTGQCSPRRRRAKTREKARAVALAANNLYNLRFPVV